MEMEIKLKIEIDDDNNSFCGLHCPMMEINKGGLIGTEVFSCAVDYPKHTKRFYFSRVGMPRCNFCENNATKIKDE